MSAASGSSDYFRLPEGDPAPLGESIARSAGSESGIRQRFSDLYEELREIAEVLLAKRRHATNMTANDLLHDAFLRMREEHERRRSMGLSSIGKRPEVVFKGCVGAACRDVLVDQIRRESAKKRGGGREHFELQDHLEIPDAGRHELLTVHEALEQLEEQDPVLAQIVEARVFGGLSAEECSFLFGVSLRTMARRWAVCVMWLRQWLS